jgi:hypothetical protein
VFLDIDSALQKIANPAGPGDDLYLEHVHYNAEGHRQLGLLFARCIQEQVRGLPWDEARNPSVDEMDSLLGVVPEDHLAAQSFAKQVYDTAPFQSALDRKLEQQRLADEIARSYVALPQERRDAFAELPMNIMAYDIALPLAELHLARKDNELARMFSNLGIQRRPWLPEAYLLNARIRDRLGDLEGTRRALTIALELRPGWSPAAEYLEHLPKP